jgi:uncharacterized protein
MNDAAGSEQIPALRIGVSEVRRRPGNRQHVERPVQLGELAISTSSVPPPGEAQLDVVMESLSDGVTVHGVVRVPWVGACRRCLEMTSGVADAEITEVFKDRPEDAEETHPIEGDAVDLGPAVHDAAVLALPLAPLCREDCPGPDPDAFPVQTPSDAAEAPADPRWAALSELRFDSDAPDSLE